jgi:hypothetical protein
MSSARASLAILFATVIALSGVTNPKLTGDARAEPVTLSSDTGQEGLLADPPDLLGPRLDICVDGKTNYTPAVAYNSRHHEYLVVWTTTEGPNTWDIWGARVDGEGAVRDPFNIATGEAEKRSQPAIAYSPEQDEYLVVYAREIGLNNHDLWAKRLRWDAGLMSAEFPIVQDADEQWRPSVAYNGRDDEYLVVYENKWAGRADVAAQRVRARDGSLLSWANVATGAGDYRGSPDAAHNPERHEYLIAYGTFLGVSTVGEVRGKLALASLDGLSAAPELSLCSDGTTFSPSDVGLAAGPNEYLVVYADIVVAAGDVYGKRIAWTGEPLGPGKGFLLTTMSPWSNGGHDVGFRGVYGYLALFSIRTADTADMDIHGRTVMPGQNEPAGGEFAIDDTAHYQTSPAIACAPVGECLVVYEDNWAPGGMGETEIRGRFVRPRPRLFLPLVVRKQEGQ